MFWINSVGCGFLSKMFNKIDENENNLKPFNTTSLNKYKEFY